MKVTAFTQLITVLAVTALVFILPVQVVSFILVLELVLLLYIKHDRMTMAAIGALTVFTGMMIRCSYCSNPLSKLLCLAVCGCLS